MDNIDKQIIEAVNSVVNPDTTERDTIVSSYLYSQFGDALNEGAVDADDIMEAFSNLLVTADAVSDFVDEGKVKDLAKKARRVARKLGAVLDTHPANRRVLKSMDD